MPGMRLGEERVESASIGVRGDGELDLTWGGLDCVRRSRQSARGRVAVLRVGARCGYWLASRPSAMTGFFGRADMASP